MNWYAIIAAYYQKGIYDRAALEVLCAAGYITGEQLVSLTRHDGESESRDGA